jgi:hypothetical protein
VSSVEEQHVLKQTYEKLFKSTAGKIVMRDMQRRWAEPQICMGGEDTIRRGAEKDMIQTIINMATPRKDI